MGVLLVHFHCWKSISRLTALRPMLSGIRTQDGIVQYCVISGIMSKDHRVPYINILINTVHNDATAVSWC